MKKVLLIVYTIIFIFSTGCNRYDYRTDVPTGYYDYSELVQSDTDLLYTYDGSYTLAQANKLESYNEGYNDTNISIIACEERYTKCILNLYLYSFNYLDNFQLTVNYLDADGEILETVSSEPQVILGNCYNSIIIDKPAEYSYVEIVNYRGENKGLIRSLEFYNFKKDGLIEQKSNTTFVTKYSEDYVVFLTEDNRVVYGCDGLQEGTFIIGRNYINKYAIVRGE